MQRQDKTYVATSKLSVRMPIVLPMQKYSYLALPMQKQKHNWNWSVEYFILLIRFSKISLFGIVLKRLNLPKIFNGVAQMFPAHKHMGVGRGAVIWKFQQKMLFS